MYVVVLILKPTGDQYHDITGFCKLFFFLFISFDEFFSWEQFHGKISFHSHFLAYTFTDNNILAFFRRLYQSQMATTEKNYFGGLTNPFECAWLT